MHKTFPLMLFSILILTGCDSSHKVESCTRLLLSEIRSGEIGSPYMNDAFDDQGNRLPVSSFLGPEYSIILIDSLMGVYTFQYKNMSTSSRINLHIQYDNSNNACKVDAAFLQ